MRAGYHCSALQCAHWYLYINICAFSDIWKFEVEIFFRDQQRIVYEIRLIAKREVSPPFGEEHRGLEQDISFPGNKHVFTYFAEVLRCPHKRIVTITKVYIARNNIHVELIRFRKNSDFIDIGKFEVGPIVSWLPCLLLCWWRRTFRDITTSVHYVQAVRTESRSKRQFGSN